MDALQRKQENRRISIAGAGCAGLALLLAFLIARCGSLKHAVLPGAYAGASLLAEEVGGYILVALAAFMAGAAIVVAIRARRRNRIRGNDQKD